MLAEFLDRISELARRADGVQVADVEGIPELRLVRKPDGTVGREGVPPARRRHRVSALVDLIALASDGEACPRPVVFHEAAQVVLLHDWLDRRDRTALDLKVSTRFMRLHALAMEPESMTVSQAVRFLRFDLHGTGADRVLKALRKVDFARRSDGATSAQHGRESLGRSVEAFVQQAEDIPEEFVVSVPIYMTPGVREASTVEVRCGVYLDVHDETIEFRVLSDELERAMNAAQSAMADILGGALECPVYRGEPGPA